MDIPKNNDTDIDKSELNFQLYLKMVKNNEMTWEKFIQIMEETIFKSTKLKFELFKELKKSIDREVDYKINLQTNTILKFENKKLKEECDELKRRIDPNLKKIGNLENPWNINSIYDLQYFTCPSCIFKKNSKQEFIDHAYKFHPESIDFLSNLIDNSLEDVICPWNEPSIKIEAPEYSEDRDTGSPKSNPFFVVLIIHTYIR